MPCKHRCGTTVRPPAFAELAEELFGRAILHSQQAADLDLDGEVARRPDIAPSLGEEQIDFRRPATDALDPRQELNGLLVVLGKCVEIELAGQDQLREAARVARLLARDARPAQFLIGRLQDCR